MRSLANEVARYTEQVNQFQKARQRGRLISWGRAETVMESLINAETEQSQLSIIQREPAYRIPKSHPPQFLSSSTDSMSLRVGCFPVILH
jgi:hypothetical protein